MSSAMLIGYSVVVYAAIGLCTALAFITAGAGRVLPQPTAFTLPARLMLLPGAAALWPYVLVRWLKTRDRP